MRWRSTLRSSSAASRLASVLVWAEERIFSHAPEADFTRRYQKPFL